MTNVFEDQTLALPGVLSTDKNTKKITPGSGIANCRSFISTMLQISAFNDQCINREVVMPIKIDHRVHCVMQAFPQGLQQRLPSAQTIISERWNKAKLVGV